MVRLTEEQYRCLDQLEYNPRCLIEGSAGTGKTLLAIEFARREASRNKKVLLVCFNKLLGEWLGTNTFDAQPDSVEVITFHQLLERLITTSSIADQLHAEKHTLDRDDLFNELYPLLALDALDEGVIEPFDTLIIDEGQDLIRSEYLDVFDGLLKGGLAGGNWSIFCDFFHQAIYNGLDADTMLSELEQRAPQHVKFKLLNNCRNTRQIAEEVSLISGFDLPLFLPASVVDGIPVDYRFSEDDNNQCDMLKKCLDQLDSSGVKRRAITLLSPVTLEHSCVGTEACSFLKVTDLSKSENLDRPANTIGFSTILAFKGLESSVVVITDIKQQLDDQHRALLYLGMSRAKHRLIVLGDGSRA
ncbi:MAG: ATP-binding domain-containing protein [Candidatus Latescibacteria bacterium]|nr:ATP-binding domain-containing protein [Candidatus Latescibacterota bacterium]